MSATSQPISPEQFALAIQDLPVENLYAKAYELENSISHLRRSNQTLQEYIDSIRADASLPHRSREEGDKDCSDAIAENMVVIERQAARIVLLRQEVERRGAVWHGSNTNGQPNGTASGSTTDDAADGTRPNTNGRLTDEELSRRMMDRIGNDSDEESQGMHL
jgi:hypothetical protein